MKKIQSTLLIALGAVTLASSCTEGTAAMFISGVLPVDPPECVAQAGGNLYRGIGVLDLGEDGVLANDYTVALEVTTNLPATFTTQDVTQSRQQSPNYPNYGNADSNAIIFEQVEVYFQDDLGDPLPDLPSSDPASRRTSSVGGSIYNQQTTLNAKAALFAPLLTSLEAQRLSTIALTQPLVGNPEARARIIARMRMIGRTTGGSTVRSPEFSFPIEVCRGCLFAAGSDANGDCPPGTTLTLQEFCFEGQDFPVTACE